MKMIICLIFIMSPRQVIGVWSQKAPGQKESNLQDQEQVPGDSVIMSEEAVQRAVQLGEENPEWAGRPLRLYLEGKGCDGFYYGVCFDKEAPGDTQFPQGSGGRVRLLVDPETLQFVRGSEIIWVDDERGAGFLVENPNHRKFRGKFFRRKNWKERLTPADGSAEQG